MITQAQNVTERQLVINLLGMNIDEIVGPITNMPEAKELIDALAALRESRAGRVVLAAMKVIWRNAEEGTDTTITDDNRDSQNVLRGQRAAMSALLADGFNLTPFIQRMGERQEILVEIEKAKKEADEEADLIRPPAD